MRIAFLTRSAPAHNAIGNHLAEKVRFFQERGAEIAVFLEDRRNLHPDLAPFTQLVEEVAAEGPIWDFLTRCDLVMAEYPQVYPLLHYLFLLIGQRPRIVIDYHGVSPPEDWPGPQRELLEQSLAQRGLIWCADRVLVHSRFMREEIHRATKFPVERISVQPLPIAGRYFDSAEPEGSWKARLGLGGAKVLLFTGRLAVNKRVPTMIRALARLVPEMPNLHAVIIGDSADIYTLERLKCETLAQELGVADRVHFLGSVSEEELAKAYRESDLLILPSIHEGCGLPVAEALASGLPVVAAHAGALPETLGPGGLTFRPDDDADLARQIQRMLAPPSAASMRTNRVGIVCFRFGPGIVGGAETSLKILAQALQERGWAVEVFTTCTRSESQWRNELPAGTFSWEGLTVHRFPIDLHDRDRHMQSLEIFRQADRPATREEEATYLRHGIHSSALVRTLQQREGEFDAFIAGPYLFGLTHDISREFPEKTLVLGCFHDEPFAFLDSWRTVYGQGAGLLYHSPEERQFAEDRLGLSHPRGRTIGTWLPVQPAETRLSLDLPYLVYCGRYGEAKNVPLVLDYAERYEVEHPGRFRWVFVGQGDLKIPDRPWLKNLGRLEESEKRAVLAGAQALVQLSVHESLSIVVLEAWAQGTPVVVHRDCAVLTGQAARAGGGVAVGSYQDFAHALDSLHQDPEHWRRLGCQGRTHVLKNYASQGDYAGRIVEALNDMGLSLRKVAVRRGQEWVQRHRESAWRERFEPWLENILDEGPRELNQRILLEIPALAMAAGGTQLIPVKLCHRGTHPLASDGPGASRLVGQLGEHPFSGPLPGLLMPGEIRNGVIAVKAPPEPGRFSLRLWVEAQGQVVPGSLLRQEILINPEGTGSSGSPYLHRAQESLAEAHRQECLPTDYIDVTLGWFARMKRWIKRKMLGNFKHAYVDVLSRQQSRVNRQLVLAVQQLAQQCASLEHGIRLLQSRIEDLEGNRQHQENNKSPVLAEEK